MVNKDENVYLINFSGVNESDKRFKIIRDV